MLIRNINEDIGNTPLVSIDYFDDVDTVSIFAKAEYLNPGGSVKDRIALNMIEEAQKRGDITQKSTLIEATSGNTGIGLAMVCATKGLKLILAMPESMSIERRNLLKHLGAQIVLTPADQGMSGSIQKAQEIADNGKDIFIVSQFTNNDNSPTHYHHTAKEILTDIQGKVDIFIASVGTGGTITGTARRLKESNPDIKIIAVEPSNSAVLSGKQAGSHGIQGIGAGFVPDILDMNLINEVITVTDDKAIQYAKDASKKAGLLVGISSGANLAIAHMVANKAENMGKTIVTVLPDSAERYMSTALFS